MDPRERRMRMAERVAEAGRQSVDALARRFGVSAETVRRDLSHLAADGLVRKVHGGAVGPKLRTEGTFQERMGEEAVAKRAIARCLARLVEPGETLFMDTGSTTLTAAAALSGTPGLTVITNACAIADTLARPGNGNARIFLLGGSYRQDNAQTAGPLAVEQVGRFRADRAILTVAALDPRGAMDSDCDEAAVARAMVAQARETVVLSAASKLDRQAAHTVCRLDDIHMLICDRAPSPALQRALDQAGVTVHLAAADTAAPRAA